MIMTMRPGSVTVAAGTATCASTFAIATAVPGRSPVHAAASADRPPARSPALRQIAAHLRRRRRRRRPGRGRRRRPRPGTRRASTTSPCSRRCTRSASRRRSAARRPSRPPRSAGRRRRRPRGPRRGSGAPSRRTTPMRSCPRSGRASACPVASATSLIRSASGCAAWCFQSLTQACGFERYAGSMAERRAVGRRGQHRAGREVDPDADDVGRVDARPRGPRPGRRGWKTDR